MELTHLLDFVNISGTANDSHSVFEQFLRYGGTYSSTCTSYDSYSTSPLLHF